MDKKSYVPLSNLKWLIATAKLSNIKIIDLLSIMNVSPDQFNDPLYTVLIDDAITVRNIVKSKNPNPAFALISGEKMLLGEFGILDYVCSSSPTVLISFTKLQQYFNILIHPSSHFIFTLTEDHVCLELRMDVNLPSHMNWYLQESIEFTFSHLLHRLRAKTGHVAIPSKMYFMHSKPSYLNEYNRIFQSDIIFNAPQNLMYFDSEIVSLQQINTKDSKLHEIITVYAETALKNISSLSIIENKIFQILKEQIQYGKPTINLVADQLYISRQTLHRRLANNGTSYTKLVDKFRKNMAITYLKDSSMIVDEISLLLGFSNTSAFHRSFKRLTGYSPVTYRKNISC